MGLNQKHRILLACLLLLGQITSNAQQRWAELKEVYIVRHAEKDTGRNPTLSPAGLQRAGDLYRVLRKKNIQKIYVSQYKRTQMTADSIRIYNGIDTVHYLADTTAAGISSAILSNAGARRILIIGHTNTIPSIIRAFGISWFYINEIPDTEYDNLFLLRLKNKKTVLKTKKYGKASPISSSGKMNIMQ